jgi:hypothetical protein
VDLAEFGEDDPVELMRLLKEVLSDLDLCLFETGLMGLGELSGVRDPDRGPTKIFILMRPDTSLLDSSIKS